ncbi:hypothetical protein CLV63_11025 [Murinocardiopsis flavida]|uniref:Sigma-70-like protein n=1 Tax=Murinocardiopsis flavida TaxID=645275 RepID=A0A2P8DHP3_9ACTN|nr:hypothetical protein [Murinocardiopsis flavida]PSK96728.1 hypothetical protein CLV63_11025 [Murinocardiopsis flavida]
MNAVSPICLTDLAPALRWSNPADVAPVLSHARLIEGWWQSLPLPRVLDIAGPAWLSNCLARLAAEQWDHLALGEFLPGLRALSVLPDEIAEPVRGALMATAGDWEHLVAAAPCTMRDWPFPRDCGLIDLVGTAMWRAVDPFARTPVNTPTPSPGLMIEAVHTLANWMPETAPEHVRSALAYLHSSTGAESGAPAATEPPQSPATRAIRTLRALRAHRDQEEAAERVPAQAEAAPAAAGAAAAESAAQSGLTRRFRSPLLGPGRTLRRPAFGPPKEMRPEDDDGSGAPAAPQLGTHPLIDLLDQLFTSWERLDRTVAAERLFAADPLSIRDLAEQSGVDAGQIRHAQRGVEERLLQWLGSPDGAPVTKHIRDLSEQLGAATTIEHLINAHPDHSVEIPALGTPLWRVIIALFTDRRMHNGWLLTADPQQLRWQTRELVSDGPSVTEAGIRLDRLGLRRQSMRAWLLSIPGVTLHDGYVVLDPSVTIDAPATAPNYAGHAGLPAESAAAPTTANGLPIRRRPADAADGGPQAAPAGPPQPKPAEVTTSARCFRAPDGRWWHRVDVSAELLSGAPVTVPPGYAAFLGLQPGRLLCLTAPGADLLVLVWRDQPAFDSLRPLLRRLSAQPGDRVFITVNGDRLDARRLPAADLPGHGATGKALHLIGYTAPASTEEALEIIARRITESPAEFGSPVDPHRLLDQLTQRGDTDIVSELRPSLYAAH